MWKWSKLGIFKVNMNNMMSFLGVLPAKKNHLSNDSQLNVNNGECGC